MGLIRKTLAVSTLGLVRGSSKKQRVAKAQLNELRAQTQVMQQQAEAELAEQRRINAENRARRNPPTEREQKAQLLWQLHKDGTLTRDQYFAAHAALDDPPATTA